MKTQVSSLRQVASVEKKPKSRDSFQLESRDLMKAQVSSLSQEASVEKMKTQVSSLSQGALVEIFT
jgi:hypothetical protein